MEATAKFRFLNYLIYESFIQINNHEKLDTSSNLQVSQTGSEDIEKSIYSIDFVMDLTGEEDSIKINVKCKGIFQFDKSLSEEEKDKFYNINAPAILFPYLRAYISSLTALSGIPPIILPTLNFAARQKIEKSKG